MLNPINPYVAGNPVGGEECFVGRADVLRDVRKVLENPKENAIVLYGQRRIGKTSILQELDEQLSKEEQYVPISFDLQDKAAWSLGDVLANLAREISYRLQLPEPNDLDFNQNNTFREVFLQRVLETLPNSSSLVLLLDEFDVLDNPSPNQAGKDFFPYLRDLMSIDREHLKFIFVIGRKPEDLDVVTLSVFKGVKAKRVSLLNKENTERLILLSEQDETLRWEKEAIDEIYNLANGHPFLTQQLCETIWNNTYDEHDEDLELPPRITKENVLDAIPDTLEVSANSLEWIWQGLESAERYVVSVLAEGTSKPINQQELENLLVEKGVRIVIHQLQSAPQILQEWDIIEPVEDRYKFRVELLRRWICQKKPVAIIQGELDYIEPQAENLYKVGLHFYEHGQLEDAVSDLQRVRTINPNHRQATLLLSQILLQQQKLTEAISLLDELYNYSPSAARPLLIQCLLEKAKIEESTNKLNEDELFNIYNRILTLSPNQLEALEKQRLIWEKRGQSAYLEKKYIEALEAFKKAGITEKVKEIKAKIRRQEIDKILVDIENKEKQKEYHQALDILSEFDLKFQQEEYVQQIKIRLEQKIKLSEKYQLACLYFLEDKKNQAKKMLEEIITIDSEFEDSLVLLLEINTGINMNNLRQKSKEKYLELQKKYKKNLQEKDNKIDELNRRYHQQEYIKEQQTKRINKLEEQIKSNNTEMEELKQILKSRNTKIEKLEKAVAKRQITWWSKSYSLIKKLMLISIKDEIFFVLSSFILSLLGVMIYVFRVYPKISLGNATLILLIVFPTVLVTLFVFYKIIKFLLDLQNKK